MLNREYFFPQSKQLGIFAKFSQTQVDSLNCIFDTWDAGKYIDLRWLAYILATTYHETATTMLPIEEYGKGRTRPYGKKMKHSGVIYLLPDKIYYGRGYVQLTWYENYELMSRLLYNDNRLLNDPELLLNTKIAAAVMFEGMLRGASSFGDFTGKCLEMYFNDKVEDPINARRIINGKDEAIKIADYYKVFVTCLKAT